MVRLPDWGDCLGDESALTGTSWAEGEEIPDATAEICSSRERIEVQRRGDRAGSDGSKREVRC
jgi:hypothetical protein